MERKITEDLQKWRFDPDRKPLIVTGCRQIGKTYSVKDFAKSEYRSSIYINFETDADKKSLFEGPLEPEILRQRITMAADTPLYDGKSVIILDEIQSCPAAYSALKPLSTDRRVDVIAMGSFLGVNLDDDDDHLSPLGYVNILRMHPMDFEEYLWAMGVNKDLIDMVKGHIRNREPVPSYFNKTLTDHFRRYIVVGGMPEVVNVYSTTGDYVRAAEAMDEIIGILKEDAGRYSRKAGRMKINACFKSIPSQLSREDKRFRYADVEKSKSVGRRIYGNALDWLEESGLVLKCLNLTEPVMPLSERTVDSSFKMYMADTGLLTRLMVDLDPSKVATNHPFVNQGALMENAIASALAKKGYPLYFYAKRNSTLEIDFVIPVDGKVGLIEVKSGRNKRSKSLNILLAEKDGDRIGFKVMESNVETDENGALHLPLYAVSFFEDPPEPELPPAPSADEMNEMFRRFKESGGE